MNFLWIYILACCCNKNNAGTCCHEHKHKKHEKKCHEKSCSCQEKPVPPPVPCQDMRECQVPQCQMPQNRENREKHCQEPQMPQEMFQNQGRFCQHPFQ